MTTLLARKRPEADTIEADYAAWVRVHDTLTAADRAAILADLPRLVAPPVISLLLPVGFATAGTEALRETLASISEQLYPHWQVCLAGVPDDADALAEIAPSDTRLLVADRTRHAEPGTAAAAAFAAADGAFVAMLAEGDRLPPQALYEIACELARFPQTGLLYSDEDLIEYGGARLAPRFKTGWDPDLLLSHDYVGGLAVYSREAIADCGGPRSGYGAAWGYDLALRATAMLAPDRIRHLPSVLYHRPAGGPRALRDRAFGPDAGHARRAAQDFLEGAAQVSPAPLLPSCNRITWPLPSPAPLVSIIMPTRDRSALLVAAAWGVLLRTDYPNLELLIVDNDSREALTATALRDLASQPRVRILRHAGPFNYAAINNAAAREARGDIVLLLNNDIDVIHQDWLREIVSHAVRPEIGAVGAKLLYEDGRIQHAGVALGPGLNAAHLLRLADRFDAGYNGQLAVTRSFSAVTGACLAVRREVWEEAGGLDDAGFAVAFNDIDFCLRLGELGYRAVCTPFAELFHLESASRGSATTDAEKARETAEIDLLWRLWRYAFTDDPFLNANLSFAWNETLHLTTPRRQKPWRSGAMR